MRILHVARYGSVKGGTEAYVAELCRGQRDAGHEVALAYRYDPDEARPEVRDGVMVAAITSRNAVPSREEADEVRRAINGFEPDIVHIHNAEASWLPALAWSLAPVVSGIHDHRLDCPTGTRYWAAWSRACDVVPGGACLGYNIAAHCGSLRANATLEPYLRWRRLNQGARNGPVIQVFSHYMAQMLRRAGINAAIEVTPYPAPALPDAVSITKPGHPVVLATGRITKEKGFDLLLESLQHVQTPVQCVIAGDGHHVQALRRKAVPSRHQATFPGWIDRATLAGWYRAADVVAVPSAWPEPFGIVGLEAMTAGKVVVATDIGGIREWLVPGQTGIAVPPRDARRFGEALQMLIEDQAMRQRMGAAGKNRAETVFALRPHLEHVVDLYKKARRSREEAA